MRDEPYEKILRDIRIFPIFEGANDVLRAFIALSGMKPLGEKLSGLGEIGLGDPIGSIGVLVDYVGGRIQREVRPDRITEAHPELSDHADAVSEQVKELRDVEPSRCSASTGQGIVERQFPQKRLADAIADIYAQVAVLSRVSRSSRTRASSPRARSATSPTRSAPARGRARPRRFDQIERQRRRADVGDREARLQARRVRLRAVRGLAADPSALFSSASRPPGE